MKKMHVSIMILLTSSFIFADQKEKVDTKRVTKDPFENMQKMIDEAREIYQKFEETCQGYSSSSSEIGLDVSQDDKFVILTLRAMVPENLDTSKDISIDVDDNLLIVFIPLKNGTVSLEAYDNRLTLFERYEIKREKKENSVSRIAMTAHESARTQLLPARVDVTNVSAIAAEYKEKEKALVLKLPKKLAKKITVSTTSTPAIEK